MIGPLVHLRVLVAAVQVVGTFGVAGGLGGWVAVDQANRGVGGAQADLRGSDAAFHAQLKKSLADGTPAANLDDLKAREAHVMAQPQPHPSFFVDRTVIDALATRAGDVRRMTVDVELREVDEEVAINQQLRTLLTTMAQDLVAARDAGMDTTSYDAVYQRFEAAAGREDIPRVARKSLDDATAQDVALKSVTGGKVASNAAVAAALQAAKDKASYQRHRALGDLAQAQAISVLDIHDVAVAIADLESRFPAAKTIDDFNNFAVGYAADARTLENLLYSRSNAYGLLASARAELAKAQGAGADVTSDAAKIAALNSQLDQASNLATIQGIAGALSFLVRDLEGLYFEARSRPVVPARAIVNNVPFYKQIYSLSCEEASLQMALAYYGVNKSQDDILAQIGVDRTPPQYDSNGTLVWGDPYTSFVGNPNGYENANAGDPASGYGTYDTTIAAAGTHFLQGSAAGAVVQFGEGISRDVIFAAAHNHQPVVAWVAFAYQPHPMRYMRAFDGRNDIMYGAPWEHAVTIAGWAPGYLLINNPHSHPEWIDAGTFEGAFAMFNHMAVIFGAPPPVPPSPSPGPTPVPTP